MSAPQSDKYLRRAQAAHRIMKRIKQALGPFTPHEMLRFDPQEKLSTFEMSQDRNGNFCIRPRGKPGFFEELYTREIPYRLQRTFWLLDDEGPAPTNAEYRKMEREILTYARRKLIRELVTRITNALPPFQKQNGGRRSEIDETERRRIKAKIKELKQSGNDGEPMSKTKAIERVADERGISARHVWRIVLGH